MTGWTAPLESGLSAPMNYGESVATVDGSSDRTVWRGSGNGVLDQVYADRERSRAALSEGCCPVPGCTERLELLVPGTRMARCSGAHSYVAYDLGSWEFAQ